MDGKRLIKFIPLWCMGWLGVGCIPAQSPSEPIFTSPQVQTIINFPLPDQMDFAGEEVPLHETDVAERLDRELMSLSYYHASTLLVLKRSQRWKSWIQTKLAKEDIPIDFFYLAVAESNLSNTAVSYARAGGMWQLMPETSREFGLEISSYVDQRRDPYLAVEAAIRYIKRAHKQLPNWTLVAASYNRGPRGILDALESQQVSSYYDLYLHEQTYRYVFKILAYKLILSDPEAYGFSFSSSDLYHPWELEEVSVSKSIPSLPAWGKKQGVTYKVIKQYNPWITSIDYSLPVKAGTSYIIRLPGR